MEFHQQRKWLYLPPLVAVTTLAMATVPVGMTMAAIATVTVGMTAGIYKEQLITRVDIAVTN